MKTTPALLAILFVLALALPAHAQQRLAGTWQVESVGQVVPPEGVSLTLAFNNNGQATLTYTLPGDDPQAWDYNFTIDAGQLTLEPAKAFGDPETLTYDIRFDAGKLLLLKPKPAKIEPEEKEKETTPAEEGEDSDVPTEQGAEPPDADEDAADTTKDSAEPADQPTPEPSEDNEEDTREPVWVLVPVG